MFPTVRHFFLGVAIYGNSNSLRSGKSQFLVGKLFGNGSFSMVLNFQRVNYKLGRPHL